MTTSALERELRRRRSPDLGLPPTDALPLTISEALAYRNAGNLPDALGRTLRLVLEVNDAEELRSLSAKRMEYEPDYHDPPNWRRAGSAHVNVVPLRDPEVTGDPRAWWETPQLAALEAEWSSTGTVAGLRVPGELRGFVYKTVLALKASRRNVDPDTVADSLERWLPPTEAAQIREALKEANS
ncbi:MAG: hypothetical protein M3360_04150 [Actinomycetota bacterium]|nr:hypothetical protein [Actinomycetota bacterium]